MAAICALCLLAFGVDLRRAHADTAAFALAPRSAGFALDARNLTELLAELEPSTIRAAVETFAGREAVETFDLLAQRTTGGKDIARDVFAGRLAFFSLDEPGGAQWMLGFEAQDDRCEAILRMLGAKLLAPGRFDSYTERLLIRRAGGWLLVTQRGPAGEAALEAASKRVLREDPALSLLGEPAMQRLITCDAPVRLFMRHALPLGGATCMSLLRSEGRLVGRLHGTYESLPFGATRPGRALDAHLVQSFERDAVFVVASPSDGKPDAGPRSWAALVPEIVPSPAMRANLSGERIMAVGLSRKHAMPSIALAWRVEDAEQAATDQELFASGLCCGLSRAAEAATGAPCASLEPSSNEPSRATECQALGPFLDRHLGDNLRLSKSVLCWGTVTTPCGGWQVYSTDPDWLTKVSACLERESCSEQPGVKVSAVGFCDGPRAAALLRRWKPLAGDDGADRVSRGIDALADAVDQLGRMRFQYSTPHAREIQAEVEFQFPARLSDQDARERDAARNAVGGARK